MVSRNIRLLVKFLLAALLAAVCIPLDSMDVFHAAMLNPGRLDVHYFWMNSIIYGGIYGEYFIYVLAAIPYAGFFCWEYQSGIWRYLIARQGTKQYVKKKFWKTFFCGGVVAALGGVFFLIFTRQFCPLFLEKRYVEVLFLPYSVYLKDAPWVYFLIVHYLLFLSGGFWSCVACTFSAYVPIWYLVCFIPYIFNFLLIRLGVFLRIPAEWRLDLWMCGRSAPMKSLWSLAWLTAALAMILWVCCCLFYKKLKWRIANE